MSTKTKNKRTNGETETYAADAITSSYAHKQEALRAIKLAGENAWQAGRADQPERANADLCLADAEKCLGRGDYQHAIERAAQSLACSVGVFSKYYRSVVRG